jgi:hypothetical protein
LAYSEPARSRRRCTGTTKAMNDQRRYLVRISLHRDEAILLCRLAGAEGTEPAVLAHRAMLWGLRYVLECHGSRDVLPTLDELREAG